MRRGLGVLVCSAAAMLAPAGIPAGAAPSDVRLNWVSIRPREIRAGQRVRVVFSIRNVGGRPLPTQGPPPRTTYGQFESWRTRGYAAAPARFRLGLTYAGPRGERYPYRWGLGRTLPTAGFRQVVGYVRLTEPGHYNFLPAVIQEGVGVAEGGSVGVIRVLPRRRPAGHQRYRTISHRIVVNGEPVAMDVPPKLISGVILVPLRFVGYGLGAEVEWHPALREAVIRGNGVTIRARHRDPTLRFDGQTITSYIRPRVIGGRMMVPLRKVGYILGAQVDWDAQTRVVSITTPRGA